VFACAVKRKRKGNSTGSGGRGGIYSRVPPKRAGLEIVGKKEITSIRDKGKEKRAQHRRL